MPLAWAMRRESAEFDPLFSVALTSAQINARQLHRTDSLPTTLEG
jgi:hypothetical protein